MPRRGPGRGGGRRLTTPLPGRWRWRADTAAALIPPLLDTIPLDRLARWLGRPAGSDAALDDAALAARVDARLRSWPRPWRYTCLKRSVVLFHLLRRAGRDVALHIGVRRADDGALAAHAWLVRGGAPYLEPHEHRPEAYTEIAKF